MGSRRATKASVVTLSSAERAYLDRLVRRRTVARGDAQRADIVLLAADGLNNCAIAAKVGVTRQTVRTWRERFAKHRLDGLCDEPRCGAPRKIGDDQVEAIVVKTLEEKPTGATHWSTRDMAKASGVSASSVQRKIGALLDAERDDTRLRCPPRSHDGLRHSRHSLPNHSRAEMARNF